MYKYTHITCTQHTNLPDLIVKTNIAENQSTYTLALYANNRETQMNN